MTRAYQVEESAMKRIAGVVPYVERLQRNNPDTAAQKQDTWPVPIKRFELAAGLSPGGSANAYALNWDSTTSDYAIDEDDTFDVYDVLGKYRGRAALDVDNPGFRGYARKFYGADRWEILDLQQQSRFIEFELDAELLATQASKAATVLNFWDGVDPDLLVAGITVWNQVASSNYVFSGASGNKGQARYDVIDDKYRITQMECP